MVYPLAVITLTLSFVIFIQFEMQMNVEVEVEVEDRLTNILKLENKNKFMK